MLRWKGPILFPTRSLVLVFDREHLPLWTGHWMYLFVPALSSHCRLCRCTFLVLIKPYRFDFCLSLHRSSLIVTAVICRLAWQSTLSIQVLRISLWSLDLSHLSHQDSNPSSVTQTAQYFCSGYHHSPWHPSSSNSSNSPHPFLFHRTTFFKAATYRIALRRGEVEKTSHTRGKPPRLPSFCQSRLTRIIRLHILAIAPDFAYRYSNYRQIIRFVVVATFLLAP